MKVRGYPLLLAVVSATSLAASLLVQFAYSPGGVPLLFSILAALAYLASWRARFSRDARVLSEHHRAAATRFGWFLLTPILVSTVWEIVTLPWAQVDGHYDIRRSATFASLKLLGGEISRLTLENQRPPTIAEIGASFQKGWPIRDGWGNVYVYRPRPGRRGQQFDLYSVGRNGVDEGGQGDDLTFWNGEIYRAGWWHLKR